MKKIHLSWKDIGIFLLILILSNILISTIYLYTSLSLNTNNTLLLLATSISFAYLGFRTGKKTTNKGYISGLIVGGISTFIMFIISIILHNYFSLFKILYYALLILITVVFAIIGINLKKGS